MSELLIAKGKIADLENQYKQYEMKADSLLIQIRELLNPVYDFMDLELEKTLILVKEFRDLQLKARNCLDQIAKIKNTYNL